MNLDTPIIGDIGMLVEKGVVAAKKLYIRHQLLIDMVAGALPLVLMADFANNAHQAQPQLDHFAQNVGHLIFHPNVEKALELGQTAVTNLELRTGLINVGGTIFTALSSVALEAKAIVNSWSRIPTADANNVVVTN